MDLISIEKRLTAIEKAILSNKRVLSFDEGCLHTGYSHSYMYKLTSSGIIPFSKPNGKSIFFDRDELDRWLLSNKRKTPEAQESEAATYVSTHRPANI